MTTSSQGNAVTHDDLVKNKYGFYRITENFESKALRPKVVIGDQLVHLAICVEWDSKTILVGYHPQPPHGVRFMNGLESWFSAQSIVDAAYKEDRLKHGIDPDVDTVLEDHNLVVTECLDCLKILNLEQPIEELQNLVRSKLAPKEAELLR